MRRVVITGLGIVAPTGIGVARAWSAVLSGKSFIRRIERFDTAHLPVKIAGEVWPFDASPLLGTKTSRQMSRFVQFACVAAHEALTDAGHDASSSPFCGCMIGVAVGGIGELEESAHVLKERGYSKVLPHTWPYALPNMASGVVAIQYRLQGPNLGICTACASGSHAIGEAAEYIRSGKCDMMLAGGAEATTCPLTIASFHQMRALSRNESPESASRPFDANRDGFVIGEGCGLLVLEELEHARSRKANIYAEIVGYGISADAHHFTSPSPAGAGLARCMNDAMTQAGINPDDVDYINAHGTSTLVNDTLESQAIQSVFTQNAARLTISSTKGATGHCLGAAGGIEAVFATLAIRDQVVPPTANYETPDPNCPLDYTPGDAREKIVRIALSNSSGFGGQNACLAFRRFD